MAGGTGTDLSQYATWPPYPGYGDWELTTLETFPGSDDNKIQEDQLPSVQYAVRYNPFSDEIPISSWTTGSPIGEFSVLWMASFTYSAIGTIQASYHLWLSTGQCGYFDLTGGPTSAQPTRFGVVPPTFEYSILDQFKEVMHYGMEGIFTAEVEPTGLVTFTGMEAFWGYMEYICRSRMKSFRVINGDIISATHITGTAGSGNWLYKLTTNLRNDLVRLLDLTSNNVLMTIYKVDNNGIYSLVQTGVKVLSIDRTTVIVEAPAPTDTSKDVPDGWIGAYFSFDKTVLVRDPQTLYFDRKIGTSTIPNNNYITETSLGYETREQQISSSGSTNGIYVSKSDLISFIQKKLSELATTSPTATAAASTAAAAAASAASAAAASAASAAATTAAIAGGSSLAGIGAAAAAAAAAAAVVIQAGGTASAAAAAAAVAGSAAAAAVSTAENAVIANGGTQAEALAAGQTAAESAAPISGALAATAYTEAKASGSTPEQAAGVAMAVGLAVTTSKLNGDSDETATKSGDEAAVAAKQRTGEAISVGEIAYSDAKKSGLSDADAEKSRAAAERITMAGKSKTEASGAAIAAGYGLSVEDQNLAAQVAGEAGFELLERGGTLDKEATLEEQRKVGDEAARASVYALTQGSTYTTALAIGTSTGILAAGGSNSEALAAAKKVEEDSLAGK